MRKKDYSEEPKTLGEHLKKRRRELCPLQREVAAQMGVELWSYINWEKDRRRPAAPQFKRVIGFLGYDPSPEPNTLAKQVEAKQRSLGASLAQIAQYLGWDPGSLRRYLDGTWRISPDRGDALETFPKAEDTALIELHSPKRRRYLS